MSKYTLDSALQLLTSSPTNFTCELMRRLLEDLGFTVKAGASGNHHTYTHSGLPVFFGSNYDCGHKAKMKPVYPKLVMKTLKQLKPDLEALAEQVRATEKASKISKGES